MVACAVPTLIAPSAHLSLQYLNTNGVSEVNIYVLPLGASVDEVAVVPALGANSGSSTLNAVVHAAPSSEISIVSPDPANGSCEEL